MAVTIVPREQMSSLRKSPLWEPVSKRVVAWAEGSWSLNHLLSYLEGMIKVDGADTGVTKDLRELNALLRDGTKESRERVAILFAKAY